MQPVTAVDSLLMSSSNPNTESQKLLKCFCNDDILCPSDDSNSATNTNTQKIYKFDDNDDSILKEKINSFLKRTNQKFRTCQTNRVCLTKKFMRKSGETYLKYSCDHSAKNSIRDEVIKFRDCRINTENEKDRKHVIEHFAEYCCDEKPFCNIDLDPLLSIRDLNPAGINPIQSTNHVIGSKDGPLLNPINLVLSFFSITVFIIAIGLFVFYSYKKFKLESAKSQLKSQIYKSTVTTNTAGTSNTTSTTPSSKLPTDSALSPYSSSTNSTTNTSIHSKENSLNQSDYNYHIKHQLYQTDSKLTSPDIYEPFLPINHHISDAIKINSPLSTTSGFICNTNTETPQSPSDMEWSGSGSGAGVPQCVQRTVARQIKLIYPCIGKGRFGEVYKGEWRGEYVAVKTFNSADEKSWENECNIYNTTGFRHENILGFIAADNIDRGLYTELWLITEFHEKGSLYDYLTLNQITPQLALKMALSITNGLVHLHMPIESCKGKPALAHCDLKSKNILVKSDLSCCIGDLGLALSGDKDGKVTQSGNIRTGTKRYMAPEILNKKIDTKHLDSFQKAEMYSLSLVLWELLHSCKFEDDMTHVNYSFEYKLPYFEYIQGDPDEALMIKIVCEQKLRPNVNVLWSQNTLMRELTRLTEELWVENPSERLNALRLKKSLTKIKINLVERKNLPINTN